MKVLVALNMAFAGDMDKEQVVEHINEMCRQSPVVNSWSAAFGKEDIHLVYHAITDQVMVPVDLTDEQCGDIIETVLVAGSSWINSYAIINKVKGIRQTVSDWVKAGHKILIETDEGDFEIGPSNIRQGMRLFIAEGNTVEVEVENLELYVQHGVRAVKERKEFHSINMGNIDANDADSILQYALFGELVYG